MISLGKEAYIPSNFYKCEKRLVHILSDDEISAFFHEIDSYSPEIKAVSFLRLSTEYKVIFRLIYCCGLRISEARTLKWSDADLGAGILTIMHSKGHKDRLVYMSDDLTVLIKEYKTVLNELLWVYIRMGLSRKRTGQMPVFCHYKRSISKGVECNTICRRL